MSTNFYLKRRVFNTDPCPHCERPGPYVTEERLHIGKSSFGWAFSLHVFSDPQRGPTNLEQWLYEFVQIGNVIVDEYNRTVSADEMREIITERVKYVAPAVGFLQRNTNGITPHMGAHYDLCRYEFE